MVAEERMRELFVRANPIPDVDVIELRATTHFEELRRRSSKMTQLDAPTHAPTGAKSKLWPALAGGLAVALAVVVALVVLTGGDAEEIADNPGLVPADFLGTWSVPVEGVSNLFLYIDADGRYALSSSFGAFDEHIIETGEWAFDGGQFIFTTDEGVVSGCGGTVGRYTTRRVDDERIRFAPATPDPCADRQHGMALGPLRAYPFDPELSDG